MAFCKKCGSELNENVAFCQNCGAAVNEAGGNANQTNNVFNSADATAEYDPADINANKTLCALSYLGILFFLPLVACPNSKFGRFHANQALIAFITYAVLGIASGILSVVFAFIPFAGGVLAGLITLAVWAVNIAILVFGIVNCVNGKAKEIPVIGKFKILK